MYWKSPDAGSKVLTSSSVKWKCFHQLFKVLYQVWPTQYFTHSLMFFFKLEFKVSAYGFPLTLIISSRDRQWCTGSLLAVTRLHFPPVLEPIDWVCLLLPTTLMSSLIVLLCPRTQRLEKLCCTSGLFWPSLCTCSVGSQSPEPSRHGVARPMDSWQPDNGVMSFWVFFFF